MATALKVLLIVGFAAVLAFVAGLLLFDEPLEFWLDCNRSTGNCTFTQKLIARSRVGTVAVASLRRAEVRVAVPRKSLPRISVWVVTDRGDYFFADYRKRKEADLACQQINDFVGDPTRGQLFITRSDKTMYWIAWGLIPLVALLVVVLASVFFTRKRRSAAAR